MLSEAELSALALSLRVAATAVLIALPFAIVVAVLLTRRRFFARSLINTLVYLPLVLPPVVMGYILLITLGPRTPIGSWLVETLGIRSS